MKTVDTSLHANDDRTSTMSLKWQLSDSDRETYLCTKWYIFLRPLEALYNLTHKIVKYTQNYHFAFEVELNDKKSRM